jgi:hypothetical protein
VYLVTEISSWRFSSESIQVGCGGGGKNAPLGKLTWTDAKTSSVAATTSTAVWWKKELTALTNNKSKTFAWYEFLDHTLFTCGVVVFRRDDVAVDPDIIGSGFLCTA